MEEETWYLMKGKPQWMIRDADNNWHESIRNKYNLNPSTGVNIKEEEEDLPIQVKEEVCEVEHEIEEEGNESRASNGDIRNHLHEYGPTVPVKDQSLNFNPNYQPTVVIEPINLQNYIFRLGPSYLNLNEDMYYRSRDDVNVEEDDVVPTCSTSQQTTEGSSREGDLQQHSSNKPLVCNHCDKKFTSNSNLIRHVRIHTGEKPFECDLCDKKFSMKGHLTSHIRTHTGEKPFTCDVCSQSFTTSSSLKHHQYKHNGEKPFPCSHCDKQFTCSTNLKHHERTHTKERPFACHQCEKVFAQKGTLTEHLRTHSGDKPFSCSVCGKTFRTSSNLNQHVKRCLNTTNNNGGAE